MTRGSVHLEEWFALLKSLQDSEAITRIGNSIWPRLLPPLSFWLTHCGNADRMLPAPITIVHKHTVKPVELHILNYRWGVLVLFKIR